MSGHGPMGGGPRGPGGGGPGGGMARGIERAKNPRETIARLASYLLAYKIQLVLVLASIIAASVLQLLGPYLIGITIDQYILKGDVAGLTRMTLVLLGIYLGGWMLQAAQGWIIATISQRALRQIRKDLFEHMQTLSLSFFDKRSQGDLMSRLTNDIDAINQALSMNITTIVSSVLGLVGILIAMFALNLWMAFGNLAVIPFMLIVTLVIGRRTMSGFRGLQSSMGRLNGRMEEIISGERVVQAFSRQDAILADFDKDNEAYRQAATKAMSWGFIIMPLVNAMSYIGIAVVSGIGGWLVITGATTVGLVATFINYSRNFVQPLRQLADLYNSIQTALAGAERVFEIIDTTPEINDKPDAKSLKEIQGDVVFEDVDFSYDGKTPVLKDVSFHARPGDIVALVGPTGAGKTTMVNVLSRFYDIQAGSIKIDGVDIRDVTRESLRRQIGTVLQDNFLFVDTVLENIRYGNLEATEEDCIAAAKLANADQFISRLPNGYKTMLTERGSNLSQGQRQLIAIARAVVANPKILILDEATSNVDTRTEIRIQEALLRLMEGRTSFVIAHRLSTIRNANQVLVINNGQIIERGTHDSLLGQRGFYFHMYNSQFRGTNGLVAEVS
ncbi:MAG: ABC transporter ATP-binding protein [Candidatus Bathyarchaeota archaeon]|jgi:ATP-binding cassette subfamily B protein|nr:ABC transporter ATP-binding protein [Candidatus Bathyarchaeota archaeon]